MLYIYSLLCFFCPGVIWQLANKKKLNGQKNQVRHLAWTYIFMLYCYLAIQDAAGIGTIWDFIAYGKIMGPINVIPFSSEGMTTYILNIFMFVPLGFLLPLIWENFSNVRKVAFTGLLFSLCIEVCQMFCFRATDIDDLIMNTLGAIAGYFTWIVFHKIFPCSGKRAISYCAAEPIIYYGLGMAGIFFLYNWRVFY